MNKKVDAILSPSFVEEMLRLAYSNKRFAEMVIDNVDVSNFPRELGGCKAMLKVLNDTLRDTGDLPTFGIVEMRFPGSKDVMEKVREVRAIKIPDMEPMVKQLETFIRRQSFVAIQRQITDMYNEGQAEQAMTLLEQKMIEINSFRLGIEGSGKFARVYRDFYKNVTDIQSKVEDEVHAMRIPSGITTLDNLSDGGFPRQDTVLFIMRSGVGKSTCLKYLAWYNTSIAHNHCLHVQLEGGKDEAIIKFDQMVANTTYSKIMRGDISEGTRKRIASIIKRASTVKSDIDVYATEEMMDTTIGDLVQVIEDYKKEYGYYPDLITLDSLDLLLTGESKKIDYDPSFTKFRLQRCAQRLKDMAKKYDCVIATATQTGDVPIEIWNDPTKVITRGNTEGDRTLVKPFSFVFTGNITMEESSQNIARIFCDKLRNYKNNGIIIRIPTNYENGFFYDISRSVKEEGILTMQSFDELENKRSRKRGGGVSVGEKEIVEKEKGVFVTQVVNKDDNGRYKPEITPTGSNIASEDKESLKKALRKRLDNK